MPVPRYTNSRLTKPSECLFVDQSGKRPTSPGGHHYLVVIVDDISRFGWTCFLKEKSDMPAVFADTLADIRAQGTPSIVECLCSGNGTEFTKGEFVTLLNHRRIRRDFTPADSPKYDGVVERRTALVLEAAMASCLEALRLFGGVPLPPTGPSGAKACVHASDAISVSARVSDKPDMLSSFEKMYGKAPFQALLPFLKPGRYHVKWALKSEPKAQTSLFLISGSNHPRDYCKVLLVSGRRTYSHEVTCEHPQEAFAGCCLRNGAGTPHTPRLSEVQITPENGEVRRCRGRHSLHRCRRGRHRFRHVRHLYHQGRHQGRHIRHRCRQGSHRSRHSRHLCGRQGRHRGR